MVGLCRFWVRVGVGRPRETLVLRAAGGLI